MARHAAGVATPRHVACRRPAEDAHFLRRDCASLPGGVSHARPTGSRPPLTADAATVDHLSRNHHLNMLSYVGSGKFAKSERE